MALLRHRCEGAVGHWCLGCPSVLRVHLLVQLLDRAAGQGNERGLGIAGRCAWECCGVDFACWVLDAAV